jgi:hypothetical protein
VAQNATMQVLSSMKDEQTFSTLSVMNSKLIKQTKSSSQIGCGCATYLENNLGNFVFSPML